MQEAYQVSLISFKAFRQTMRVVPIYTCTLYNWTSSIHVNSSVFSAGHTSHEFAEMCPLTRDLQDWLIDWLLNVQRAVFQPYSGRKQVYKQKIRKRVLGWVNNGNDFWLLCWVGSENLAEAEAQWPLLNELCKGIFNVQRAWHSLKTGPWFSFSFKGQVGQIFIPQDSNGWPW